MNLTDKPICLFCKHYRGLLKCGAYPNGIPSFILEDTALHHRVFSEQKGDQVFEFDESSRHVKLDEVWQLGVQTLRPSSGDNTES